MNTARFTNNTKDFFRRRVPIVAKIACNRFHVCLSVCLFPNIRVCQCGCHRTNFSEILYWELLMKIY